MANMLLEKYSKKLQLSESVYGKGHAGDRMDMTRKITIAKALDNTSKFLNEAFDSSMGTQRASLGEFKKFCLALTTVGLPNLIAFDLVTVSPMSSIYGNIAYIQYTKGTDKGESAAGDLTNDIWSLGKVDSNYTGSAVVEPVESFTSGTTAIAFKQGAAGARLLDADGVQVDDADGTHPATINAETGVVTQTSFKTGKSATDVKKIAYVYNNVEIPQEKLPTLKAELKNIQLEAKARRIAVYYSQMAAFQAKTDYGFDLADGLAEQAVSQLSYEIDTEIVEMLYNGAVASEATSPTGITPFSKTQPIGISLADHYAAFAAKVEEYKMALYDRTKKFAPDYIVVASNIMPVLSFVPGFQPASVSGINGPYMAGTFNGMKVFVSPALPAGKFFFGVNQGALQAASGCYCPYMAVVPTQLLGFADGGMEQGWSTMYDAKILNQDLLVLGEIVA